MPPVIPPVLMGSSFLGDRQRYALDRARHNSLPNKKSISLVSFKPFKKAQYGGTFALNNPETHPPSICLHSVSTANAEGMLTAFRFKKVPFSKAQISSPTNPNPPSL